MYAERIIMINLIYDKVFKPIANIIIRIYQNICALCYGPRRNIIAGS